MKKFVVKLGLREKSVEVKVQVGRQVHGKMTGNSNFIAPSPTLAELKTATDELEAAHTDVTQRNMLDTAILREKEEAWDELVTALGKYVDNVARGSESIILSSGMETKRQRSPIGIPYRVTGVKAGSVSSGELLVTWDESYGTLIYLGYVKLEGESDDKYKLLVKSSRRNATVSGLQSGKKYHIVIEAVGTAGAGELSDVARSFIL